MKLLKNAALIASTFSVLFSLSIVLETKKSIHLFVFMMLFIFILFFLIMNEFFKVKSLQAKFNNQKYSILILITTFSISVTLSCIGIYLWIDKTYQNKVILDQNFNNAQMAIVEKFNLKNDSINHLKFDSDHYNQKLNNLSFWKKRNCYSNQERMQARENIKRIESEIDHIENEFLKYKKEQIVNLNALKKMQLENLKSNYSNNITFSNQNKFLYMIFFSLVLLTEIMIGYIHYSISNFYSSDQKRNLKILFDILQNHNDTIQLDDIRYNHHLNPTGLRDQDIRQKALNFLFLLGNLNIIDKKPPNNGLIINKRKAHSMLKNYYNKTNTI